jgi:hypothetical protein
VSNSSPNFVDAIEDILDAAIIPDVREWEEGIHE